MMEFAVSGMIPLNEPKIVPVTTWKSAFTVTVTRFCASGPTTVTAVGVIFAEAHTALTRATTAA